MSAQGTDRFYSVKRQTILLVNREPLGRERVNNVKDYVPIKCQMSYDNINCIRRYSVKINPCAELIERCQP